LKNKIAVIGVANTPLRQFPNFDDDGLGAQADGCHPLTKSHPFRCAQPRARA
jgi:hypothetical protein